MVSAIDEEVMKVLLRESTMVLGIDIQWRKSFEREAVVTNRSPTQLDVGRDLQAHCRCRDVAAERGAG